MARRVTQVATPEVTVGSNQLSLIHATDFVDGDPPCEQAFKGQGCQFYPDFPLSLKVIEETSNYELASKHWSIRYNGGSTCNCSLVKYYSSTLLSPQFAPACCDKSGCSCNCITSCATRHQIKVLLEANVVDHKFRGCTVNVSSEANCG